MSSGGQGSSRESGYAMAALLVAVSVMAVIMTVALPTWRHMVQREKEEELIFRGQQYVRAIQLYQRKFAGAYPPDFNVLLKLKYLRKKYKDPMTEDGAFEMVYQGSLLMPPAGRGGGQRGGPGSAQPAFSFDSRSGTSTQAGQIVGPRGGVVGVRSKSTAESIRVYNGATHYNEWRFVFTPMQIGPGTGRPGMGPGRGGPGMGGPGSGGPGGGRGGPRGMGGQRGQDSQGDQPVRRQPN